MPMALFMVAWCDEDLHELCRGLKELMSYCGAIYRCNCLCHRENLSD